MEFEANGALAAGFHDCTYSEFREAFVVDFPTSQRRLLIAENLLDFSKEVFSVGIPVEFWVDGSYATRKINPNDADIVLFFLAQDLYALAPRWTALRRKYNGILDTYYACAVCPENERMLNPLDYEQIVNNRNYWRGQFGFDRKDNPKGIIRLDCKSIVEELRGR